MAAAIARGFGGALGWPSISGVQAKGCCEEQVQMAWGDLVHDLVNN